MEDPLVEQILRILEERPEVARKIYEKLREWFVERKELKEILDEIRKCERTSIKKFQNSVGR